MDCTVWGIFSRFEDLLSAVLQSTTTFAHTGRPFLECLSGTLLCCVLVFVAATFLWRQHYQRGRDPSSKLPLPPGCMGYPIIGESLAFIFCGSDYYLSRRRQYGHVYKTHLLGQPTVRVIGAQRIRAVLMGEHTTVASSWPRSTRLLMGAGSLLNSTSDTHRARKKILLEALSPEVVAGYVPRIQELIRTHIRVWCGQGKVQGMDVCKKLSISLTADVVLGFRLEEQEMEKTFGALRIFLDNLFSLPLKIPWFGLWKGLKARETLIGQIKTILSMESTHKSIVDDLKNMNQNIGSQTADDLADAILELWFASNDTSASLACSTVLALGRNEHIVARIEEELAEHHLLGGDTVLTYEQLNGLAYVNQVVSEVLRIYPPVGGGFRKTTKTMEIGGYQIPKGWTVIYSIRDTHQTSELFDQGDKFIPERWNGVNKQIHEQGRRFHYIPFGAGARVCPGSKFAQIIAKIFIVELVRTCTWKLKNCNPKIKFLPITQPIDGLPVTFTLRSL